MRHFTGAMPAAGSRPSIRAVADAMRVLTTRSPYHVDLTADQFAPAARNSTATLENVSLDIQVVLGTTAMPIHQVLRLGRGAIIELDATEDDEVRILANNFPVARGMVVVQGNRIAVEVTELLPRAPDAR